MCDNLAWEVVTDLFVDGTYTFDSVLDNYTNFSKQILVYTILFKLYDEFDTMSITQRHTRRRESRDGWLLLLELVSQFRLCL